MRFLGEACAISRVYNDGANDSICSVMLSSATVHDVLTGEALASAFADSPKALILLLVHIVKAAFPVFVALGAECCQSLTRAPSIARAVPGLELLLMGAASSEFELAAAAAASNQRTPSPVIGPLQNVFSKSLIGGFTLPFCASVDSRKQCSTREELALYQNREKCKDAFLSLFRSFRAAN